jgi:iron complex outermembrane receptor protein
MGAVSFDHEFDRWKGSIRFFYNMGEHNISDGFRSNDKNYGVVAYESFNAFSGNTITVGIDYKNYGGNAENWKAMGGQGIQFVDTALYELGEYVFVQQELFEKLMLNAGFRADYNSSFGMEYIPSAGFAYKLARLTTIKGSVSKGYRSPTIRELYMWSPANDSLNPERMINYELNILQRLFHDKVSFELSTFYAIGDNLIKMTGQGANTRYENTGEFTHWGTELSVACMPIKSVLIDLSYSYLHMKEPEIASPEHMLFVSMAYNWKKFNFNLSLQSINKLFTQIVPEPESQSYNLINGRIKYTFNKYISFFVKGENLLNESYEINYGYTLPGITAFVGINFHLPAMGVGNN